MAIPFLSNIDMNKNEIQNLVLHSQTSDPTGSEGQIYYNSNTNKVLVHNGSSFINISGDIASVTLTGGDGVSIPSQPTDSDGNYTATINADLKANGGLVIESEKIAVDLGASSITGTLAVADGGTGVTSKTGTGSVVLSNSPTLVTPALGTPSALVGTNITGTAASLTAGKVTVTEDTSSNTNFNVVYHDGSNALLDESSTGGFTYNPSTETLSVKNLSVTVKTTQKDVEVINTSGGIIFEGDTADDNETTLDVIDPTQDNTINLPNASGTVQLTGDTTREVALTLTPGGSSGQQGHITKSTNTYTVDQRLGTRDVACQVYHTSNYDTVHVDVTRATVNTVEVAFGQSVTNGDYKILITKIG